MEAFDPRLALDKSDARRRAAALAITDAESWHEVVKHWLPAILNSTSRGVWTGFVSRSLINLAGRNLSRRAKLDSPTAIRQPAEPVHLCNVCHRGDWRRAIDGKVLYITPSLRAQADRIPLLLADDDSLKAFIASGHNQCIETHLVRGLRQTSTSLSPSDYDRLISCSIDVQIENCSGCGSASDSDTGTIFAELTPYVTDASDSGNFTWNGVHRRDIWYQIWHADSVNAWSRGGTIDETLIIQSNPCNYEVQTGVGPINSSGQFLDTYYSPIENPACAVLGTQLYRLSTSGYHIIREQSWRWDNTGIWRQ